MKLKELFADEKRWTQKAFGRTPDGTHVSGADPQAVCFCLVGGMIRCYPNQRDYEEVREKIIQALGSDFYMAWNDAPERTIEDIQKLCNELDI